MSTEREEMLAFIKQLSDGLLTVRPLGGSELFVRRFGAYYADPVYCQALILKQRTDLHEATKEKFRAMRAAPPAAGSEMLAGLEMFADHGAPTMQEAQEIISDALLEIKRLAAAPPAGSPELSMLLRLADHIVAHGRSITYPSIGAAQEVRNVVRQLAEALRRGVAPAARSGAYPIIEAIIRMAVSDGEYIGRHGNSMTAQAVIDLREGATAERLKAASATLAAPSETGRGELGEPHPHWSERAKNENYPKTIEEWNPRNDPVGEHLARAVKRLRVAMDHNDPRAPAEMAIVSRWDLTTLVHDWWHKCAVFDIWRKERAERATAQPETASNVREAIGLLHAAYGDLCVRFSGVHSDDAMDGTLLQLHGALKKLGADPLAFPPAESQTKIIDPVESVGIKGARQQAMREHKSMLTAESSDDQGEDWGERHE